MTHHLTTTTKHHLRASWIATVLNLDWPSKQSLAISNEAERVALQQRELTAMLDEAVSLRMNAVFFQVRPCADAFYRSTLVPWSRYLTGTLGQDPGFDPLAFVIEQAHRRNLELHAWFNPYRVSMDRSPATVEQLNRVTPGRPASVYQAQPQWIASASDRFVIDPGIPQARSAIVEAVMEVARNYDIDGVHFDDYFYYESAASPLDDSATFARYGQDFADKGDWRRDNTYQLIRELSAALREFDPGIKFGVSPAGVWRNQSVDPLGSATRHGAPNYDVGFADTRRWVHEELLDYILPQVYWTFDLEVAPFEVVAKWWADTVHGRNVHLYIGEALYKVGVASAREPGWAEDEGITQISRQLTWNTDNPQVSGSVLFRHLSLRAPQAARAVAAIRAQVWQHPALIPAMAWKTGRAPQPPVAVRREETAAGTQLQWQDHPANTPGQTRYYAVYRSAPGKALDTTRADGLVATVRCESASAHWTDANPDAGAVTYGVTALDRGHFESAATLAW